MAEVDPFTVQIPQAFGKDPAAWTLADSLELLEWCRYLHRWCHDMWVRSGGAVDQVEAVADVVVGDEPELPDGRDPAWEEDDWLRFAVAP